MNKILSTLALGLALSTGAAFAASHAGAPMAGASAGASAAKKEPSAAQKAQQDKMKACNADPKAKSLKGEERQKFMSECLKG